MNRLWVLYMPGPTGYILGVVDSYQTVTDTIGEYSAKGITVCYMECVANVLNRVELQFIPAPLPK